GAAVLLEDVTRFRLLDEVKSNLVATVSHELKTPLSGLRLAIHLLAEEAVGPLTPKQLELLLDARDNAERLLTMVNELLEMARLEQGEVPVDLRPERPLALLYAVADAVRPRAEDKGVELTVEPAEDLPDVAAHGGRVTCESAVGKGTVFRVTLPVWGKADKETRRQGDKETGRMEHIRL